MKKNGDSERMCIDYSKCNKITKKIAHPLPLTDEHLEKSPEKKITILDISGYYQIPIEKNLLEFFRSSYEDAFRYYEWSFRISKIS